MLTLISPAKRLDEAPSERDLPVTRPALLKDSRVLLGICRRKSAAQLSQLMDLSEALSQLNAERFARLDLDSDAGKAAVLLFAGDVYVGLDAGTLRDDQLEWAQDHLGLLSGLFGFLRPLDLIGPYRLEMGTKLKSRRGANLYQFWGDRVTRHINRLGHDAVVNLASNEYFKVTRAGHLKPRVVTPIFHEVKDGRPRVISFLAKKARGTMTRWIIDNQVDRPQDLRHFDLDRFELVQDEGDRLVFQRDFVPAR